MRTWPVLAVTSLGVCMALRDMTLVNLACADIALGPGCVQIYARPAITPTTDLAPAA